jgi:L-ascorbate metabolism protein UlaG (beta-lactamase superfamily)
MHARSRLCEDADEEHLLKLDDRNLVYLDPKVKIEPLVCGWYAWAHLVAPLQLAMHLCFRLLPLLQSFVSNAGAHLAANKDPKMYGGPFVCLEESDVPAVRSLLEDTKRSCAGLILLAQDWRTLNSKLEEGASGFSLNEFYEKLPGSLEGLVELVYDINHHASARILEGLLYEDELERRTHQILVHKVGEWERQFFMSTPRLRSSKNFIFNIRFSDARLDVLSSMRTEGRPFAQVADLLEVSDEERPAFRKHFSESGPENPGTRNYVGEGVRVRYFGHACLLFQTTDVAVLFDPFFAIEQIEDGRLGFNDLPEFIDYVVLTHCHQDHCAPEMLIQLRHRVGQVVVPANNAGCIADPSMRLILQALGYKEIVVTCAFDRIPVTGGEVVSLPFVGEHADLNIHTKQMVALTLRSRRFLMLVDSDCRDRKFFRKISAAIGPLDALFLGMECHGAPLTWLYEPLLGKPVSRRNSESRRLSGADCEHAWNAVSEFTTARALVYAMGQEPWMKYIMGLNYEPDSIQLRESDKFVARCKEAGIQSQRLFGSWEMVL